MKTNKTNAAISVFSTLNDESDARTDKYETEWNGYWHFFNVMQFLGSFAAVTTTGLAQGIYDELPVQMEEAPGPETAESTVCDDWIENLEYIDQAAKSMADKLIALGVPAPSSVGYELEDDSGAGVAEAEMAWEEQKITYLTPMQEEYRSIFEAKGWTVITDNVEPTISIFKGGVN